jgi:bifunctional UDP-N-acetylglucosamine pyrophosphorylase/glucosamine-1-phosphate N-acetyltransferase
LTVVVLAAGKGKRMRSRRSKLLHEVAGLPMVAHVLHAARALRPSRVITVVGHGAAEVRPAVDGLSDAFVLQREQRGTADAVLRAGSRLRGAPNATLVILNGDVPALRPSTLRALVARHRASGAALSLVTAEADEPSGYGRIVRDGDGRVRAIVEHADASAEHRRIREINCGIYCSTPAILLPVLRALEPHNVQREYYITDAVRHLIERGQTVLALRAPDAEEVLGVNDRVELARAAATLFARKAEALQRSGVTLLDPTRAWIDPRARIGRDTVIYPDVVVEGPTVIGVECVVRPGCRLVNSVIGRRAEIKDHSVIVDSRVGHEATVGPFAHLRPGSVLEGRVRVGNFVEVKKARLRRGTKASHLSYLGDADIGANCNIGAGTITCNFDGERKLRTVLGKQVFVGSDTQLVAPVFVGDGAYVGAGTTVTRNVPAGSLALSRTRQINIEGWARRRRARRRRHAE